MGERARGDVGREGVGERERGYSVNSQMDWCGGKGRTEDASGAWGSISH